MSDPVTNIQIEDVLSSIRRLVSEEIGQQTPLHDHVKARKAKEDVKLILSPAQKVRQDAAEKGEDLWKQTEELKSANAAPVWWHRDPSRVSEPRSKAVHDRDESEQRDLTDLSALVKDDVLSDVVSTQSAFDDSELHTGSDAGNIAESDVEPLKGALAGLKAARDIYDAEWENPEGEEDMVAGVELGAMPWQGVEETVEYSDLESPEPAVPEANNAEPDDKPFKFRPGERLFERLSSKKMSAAPIPEVETVDASISVAQAAQEQDDVVFKSAHAPTSAAEEPQPDWSKPTANSEPFQTVAVDDAGDQDPVDLSEILDEDMLRDLVRDVIRQELQGTLGERITRNVRKLVRREIQRALAEVR